MFAAVLGMVAVLSTTPLRSFAGEGGAGPLERLRRPPLPSDAVGQIPHNVLSLLNPLSLDAREGALLAGAVGSVVLLAHADVRTFRTIENRWPNPRILGMPAFDWASLPGDGQLEVGGLIALYVAGGARDRSAAVGAFEALVATGVVVRAMKWATGVPRPSDSPDHRRWGEFSLRHDAFPSGHVAGAIAVATVLGESYDQPWLPAATAVVVGLGRIKDRSHWLSDVLAGAAIGSLFGRRGVLLHGLNRDVRLVPTADGLRVAVPF